MSDQEDIVEPSPTAPVGGRETARVTRTELADRTVTDCVADRQTGGLLPRIPVFSSNGQGVALAVRDPAFMDDLMRQEGTIHADGMPVVLGSRFMRPALPDRNVTTGFFHDAAEAASREGPGLFFLGATEEQNAAAVAWVREMHPGLEISGRQHGFLPEAETAAT